MHSKIYPNIVFLKNHNLAFIGSHITQTQQLIIFHPNDPLIPRYTSLVQKLFSQITILSEMLWVCKIVSTSIVRVYFSEPYQYPVGLCCQQPLFVEFNYDLSGTFVCSKCSKVISKFVYTTETNASDEEIFRRRQKESKSRKQNLRELLTSQKFRGKNLKNNFITESKLNQKGGFIMQITEPSLQQQFKTIQQLSPQQQQKNSKQLNELKEILNDIFA